MMNEHSEEAFLNNFDLVDFLDDEDWPFDYAEKRMPNLHKQEDKQYSAAPLDDDLYQMENMRRFGPMINF